MADPVSETSQRAVVVGDPVKDISAARGGPRARGGLSAPQAAGPPVHFIFQNLASRSKNRTVQIDVLTALGTGAAAGAGGEL